MEDHPAERRPKKPPPPFSPPPPQTPKDAPLEGQREHQEELAEARRSPTNTSTSSAQPGRVANYQKRSKAAGRLRPIYAVGTLAKTCSTASTTSSAPPRRSAARPRRRSPTASTWSTSNSLATLAKYGVEPIEALGRQFDPNQHEALVRQPAADKPEGTVVAELSKGYKIHDRVLRPSQVAVSVKPADS